MSWTAFEPRAKEYDQWFDRHEPVYQAEVAARRKFIPGEGLSLEVGIEPGGLRCRLASGSVSIREVIHEGPFYSQ